MPGKRAANQALAELTEQIRQARWEQRTRRVTVDELLDEFLDQTDAERSTVERWRQALSCQIRPHIGDKPIDAIDVRTLEVLYRRLAEGGGRRGRPLSASTIRKVHVPLRLAFEQARRWGWIAANPAADAHPPKVGRQVVQPPSDDVLDRLIRVAEARDVDFAVLVRLGVNLGARRGEICALRWSDFDLDGATVTIRRVVQMVGHEAIVVERAKTAASVRSAALGPAVVAALRAMRHRHQERNLALGIGAEDSYLFGPDKDPRRPMNPGVLNVRWRRLRKAAGVGDVRFHDLRHAVATRMLGQGYDVRTVAGRLGHANASMTLGVYAHFLPARDAAAAVSLEEGIGNGGQ
ncbi:MAG TPA: site-specific integrase [Acidimicrobiales bacterium]|nr:site-specific integrase [Acidimicrobiales bacterium]